MLSESRTKGTHTLKDKEDRQGLRREEVDQCGLTGLTIVIIGSASTAASISIAEEVW